MKKTTLILLALVIAIGGIAYYILQEDTTESTKYRLKNERDFSIRNGSDVHHIMIAHNKTGEVVNIDRDGDQWMLNGEYVARQWSVSNLLNSIRNLQIRSIPGAGETKYLLEAFQINGIKVVLRDKDKKIVNSFIIGPNAVDGEASYFMKEGKTIYMCEVKNFKGAPRRIFQFEVKDYRSVNMIVNKDDKIKEIRVDYPQFKDESFALKKTGNEYSIKRLHEFPLAPTELNQGFARSYYQQYDEVFGEVYFPELGSSDSLMTEEPFAVFTVIKEERDTTELTLWPTESIRYIKDVQDIHGQIDEENIPRFWVYTSDGDWMKMQVQPNIGILRGYSYFFD